MICWAVFEPFPPICKTELSFGSEIIRADLKNFFMENNVVIYQSNDGLVKMKALVDAANETIWATQKAMTQLFG